MNKFIEFCKVNGIIALQCQFIFKGVGDGESNNRSVEEDRAWNGLGIGPGTNRQRANLDRHVFRGGQRQHYDHYRQKWRGELQFVERCWTG